MRSIQDVQTGICIWSYVLDADKLTAIGFQVKVGKGSIGKSILDFN
jgi:hypothetical protein